MTLTEQIPLAITELSEYGVAALDLDGEDHLEILAVVQTIVAESHQQHVTVVVNTERVDLWAVKDGWFARWMRHRILKQRRR